MAPFKPNYPSSPETGLCQLLGNQIPQDWISGISSFPVILMDSLPCSPHLSRAGGSTGRVGSACAPPRSASEPGKSTHVLLISGETSPGLWLSLGAQSGCPFSSGSAELPLLGSAWSDTSDRPKGLTCPVCPNQLFSPLNFHRGAVFHIKASRKFSPQFCHFSFWISAHLNPIGVISQCVVSIDSSKHHQVPGF